MIISREDVILTAVVLMNTSGNSTDLSICTCIKGFSFTNYTCIPICGDGLLEGNETCDDGNQGLCL